MAAGTVSLYNYIYTCIDRVASPLGSIKASYQAASGTLESHDHCYTGRAGSRTVIDLVGCALEVKQVCVVCVCVVCVMCLGHVL